MEDDAKILKNVHFYLKDGKTYDALLGLVDVVMSQTLEIKELKMRLREVETLYSGLRNYCMDNIKLR